MLSSITVIEIGCGNYLLLRMGKIYIFIFVTLNFLVVCISRSEAYSVTFHDKQNFLDKASKIARHMEFLEITLEIFFNTQIYHS